MILMKIRKYVIYYFIYDNYNIDDPKEDESQSIENDNNLVKEINISLYKHIKEHEKC